MERGLVLAENLEQEKTLSSRLPSRRELRLARQRELESLSVKSGLANSAKEAEIAANNAKVEEVIPEKAESVNVLPADAVIEKPAAMTVRSPLEELDAETEILNSIKSVDLSGRKNIKAFNAKFEEVVARGRSFFSQQLIRRQATVLGAVAAVVAAGTLVANAASDTPTSVAVGAQASVLASVNHEATESATPETLLDEAGAEDQAKLAATEEFAAENNVKCIANSGANSLLGSFAEESSEIFMPMPAGSFRYTSPYGFRTNPFGGGGQMHTGIDMAAPAGTPYYAIADGVVVVNGAKSGRFGNDIVIRHEIDGEVFYSWYIHSYADGIFVEEGQEVKAGDHIGNVGSSGYSTGPHLHFEIRDGSEYSANSVEPSAFMKEHGAIDLQARCS